MEGLTRILFKRKPRGCRRDLVPSEGDCTRKEWEEIFKDYTPSAKYNAANLAAHNWDIVIVNGRVLAGSYYSSSHWIDKDGTEVRLTEEEVDRFYPRAEEIKRGCVGYGTDHNRVVRQEEIVL